MIYRFIRLFSLLAAICISITVAAQPAAPTITGSSNYCEGSTIVLTASSAAASPSYNWTGPGGFSATTSTISIPSAGVPNSGIYSVTVTSGGLTSAPSSITVTITAKPLPPATPGSPYIYCRGDNPKPLNAIGANVLWYTDTTKAGSPVTPIPATTATGTITYYASQTINGCESYKSKITVTVKPKPAVPAVSTINYCQNDIALPLTAGGTNLLWYLASSGGIGTHTAPIPGTSYPDTNYYYVTQTVNGCESDRSQLAVVVNYKPNALILPNEPYVCQHDTMSFSYYGNGTPDAAYNWTMPAGAQIVGGNGQGPVVIRFDSAGARKVLLQVDNHGCKSPFASYIVDVRQSPVVPLIMNKEACQGQTVTVATGTANETINNYVWDFGPATVLYGASGGGPYGLRWNTQGMYVVKLTAISNSCPSVPVLDTIYIHPLADAHIQYASSTNVCTGDSVHFTLENYNPAYLYQWTPSSFFTNETNQADVYGFIGLSGYVHVTATTEYGCTSADSVMISTHSCCKVTFPNAFTPNGDGLNDVFRPINQGRIQIKDFRVFDRWGKAIFESRDQRLGWDGKYNGIPQDMGTYFYFIQYLCADGKQYEEKGELMLIK
ncbi:MAG: gliding motility-associated C-terminal domain-containing protein [Flavipsychrobacter sp.]